MLRQEFSIFREQPNLVYLDYAATTPLPDVVVKAVLQASVKRAPIQRSLYPLAGQATAAVQESRTAIANFFSAKLEEVIFQSSATQALHQVILGLEAQIRPSDLLITSTREHHSLLAPLLKLASRTGAKLKYIEIDEKGEFEDNKFAQAKLVALSLTSNVTGAQLSLDSLSKLKTQQGRGGFLLLDCCQSASHSGLDFSSLPADFAICAGHKLYGPSGVAILLGRERALNTLDPLLSGGGNLVSLAHSEVQYRPLPEKLEAGSPNQEAIIGLAAALNWLTPHLPVSHKPLRAIYEVLAQESAVRIISPYSEYSGLLAFTVNGIHAHDVAEFFGEKEICVRAGQHCASLFHQDIPEAATVRISTGLGSTEADALRISVALKQLLETFHAQPL